MANAQIQRQKQEQKLTPQQLMLARLLQVPAQELEQAVKAEIEKNPLLEDEHIETDQPQESSPEGEQENPQEGEDELDFEEREIDPFATEDDEEMDYRFSDSYGSNRSKDDEEKDPREVFITSEVSFSSYLIEQLSMKPLSEREMAIGQEIIGSIDASGYLGRSVELIANDLAFKQNIDTTPEEVERVLAVIQELDPAGVGARDLRECLSLQLHRMPEADYNAVELVDHHFEEFTSGRLAPVMERLAMSQEQLEEAIACIRGLNPKPGSAFAEGKGETAQYLVPDFVVTSPGDGRLELELNDGDLPRLRVSRYYRDMLRQMERKGKPTAEEQETIRFIRERAESAQWFIDMLGQRKTTLRVIMEQILDYQHDYFLSGLTSDLRPMRLQDIAGPAKYDISTVSRVVNQKSVQTPFGTFLLRDLFTHGVLDGEGKEVSADAVRQVLQEIVDQEDKSNPLTDEELAEQMSQRGYPLSRRTVAKYREQMGIPVRRLRTLIEH